MKQVDLRLSFSKQELIAIIDKQSVNNLHQIMELQGKNENLKNLVTAFVYSLVTAKSSTFSDYKQTTNQVVKERYMHEFLTYEETLNYVKELASKYNVEL